MPNKSAIIIDAFKSATVKAYFIQIGLAIFAFKLIIILVMSILWQLQFHERLSQTSSCLINAQYNRNTIFLPQGIVEAAVKWDHSNQIRLWETGLRQYCCLFTKLGWFSYWLLFFLRIHFCLKIQQEDMVVPDPNGNHPIIV